MSAVVNFVLAPLILNQSSMSLAASNGPTFSINSTVAQ